MIRFLSSAALIGLGFTAMAQAETRAYDVAPFSAMKVSAGIDVTFTTGGPQSISVENKKGDFSDIEIDVKGDTLVIKRAKSGWGWNKKQRYLVTVSTPTLTSIKASSGSDVTGSGMTGDTLSLEVSSGADLVVKDVSGGTVDLDSSSGSDLTVTGTCTNVRADSSSGSDIDAGKLICATGRAEASSGSDITLHVTDTLVADASSGADIHVRGGPRNVDTDKSSGGSVNIRS